MTITTLNLQVTDTQAATIGSEWTSRDGSLHRYYIQTPGQYLGIAAYGRGDGALSKSEARRMLSLIDKVYVEDGAVHVKSAGELPAHVLDALTAGLAAAIQEG